MEPAAAVTVVERVIRATQNPSSALEETGLYVAVKTDALGILFPFLGQPAAVSNLILRDWVSARAAMRTGRGRRRALGGLSLTLAGIAANVILVGLVRQVVAAVSRGRPPWDEDDDRMGYAILSSAREAIDVLHPLAGRVLDVLAKSVQAIVAPRGVGELDLFETTLERNVGGILDGFAELVQVLRRPYRGDVEDAKLQRSIMRLLEGVGGVSGLPVSGPMQYVRMGAGAAGYPLGDVTGARLGRGRGGEDEMPFGLRPVPVVPFEPAAVGTMPIPAVPATVY